MAVAPSNLTPANSHKAASPPSWVARAKEYFLLAVRKVYAPTACDLAFLSIGIFGYLQCGSSILRSEGL